MWPWHGYRLLMLLLMWVIVSFVSYAVPVTRSKKLLPTCTSTRARGVCVTACTATFERPDRHTCSTLHALLVPTCAFPVCMFHSGFRRHMYTNAMHFPILEIMSRQMGHFYHGSRVNLLLPGPVYI